VKLPGTLTALATQLKSAGYGTPTSLSFDADGNLTSITLGPATAEVAPLPAGRPVRAMAPKRPVLSMVNAALPIVETRSH
jgi:hypothetical protein